MPKDTVTPKATIDACIPQELWKTQDRASVVTSLLDLARDASLELAVTTRVDQDIPNMPLSARIRELPEVGVQTIGAPFRLDLSKTDGDDVLASTGFGEVRDSIEAELEAGA